MLVLSRASSRDNSRDFFRDESRMAGGGYYPLPL